MKTIMFLKSHRRYLLPVIDVLIILFSYMAIDMLMADSLHEFTIRMPQVLNSVLIAVIAYELFFNVFNVYRNIIRYESGKDYLVYLFACLIACVTISTVQALGNLNTVGIRENIMTAILISVSIIAYRLLIRIYLNSNIGRKQKNEYEKKNLLLIGGGSATRDIIKIIKSNMKNNFNIVGIIDDNPNKYECAISGVRIIGNRHQIIPICKEKKIDTIFFSISSIDNENKKEILNICKQTGAKLRILPSTEDIIRNKNLMENLRDVEIEDLLGRDPIVLDNKNIGNLIENQVILVTGGGGSIGSELCRQIIKYNPKKLVMLDIYENNLYDIELELKESYPKMDIHAVIGSVRDRERLEEIFKEYRPYIVFHAAAHKHVPLMEVSPLEAIVNNVFGTYHVVECCDKYRVKKFTLVSTDKAVNPTNIMGATKRLCEMIVQAKNKVSNTEYVAVRFGNVLGSNGSVVPLFKKQIAKGGPVTVTHKDITRFFMTIPEAVGLILQATTYATGGEIFVLDMGEPVKIYDLAVSLIQLSGLEPNVDIPIKVTGLRPGEKLYEELLMSEEGLKKTGHDKIFVARPMDITQYEMNQKLDILRKLEYDNTYSVEKIQETVAEVVPTYQRKDEKLIDQNKTEELKNNVINLSERVPNGILQESHV